jgi:hypothetical protein
MRQSGRKKIKIKIDEAAAAAAAPEAALAASAAAASQDGPANVQLLPPISRCFPLLSADVLAI